MITFLASLLIIFIASIAYLFVSYNHLYDLRFLNNVRKVENYYIVKENNKLFPIYFEKTNEEVYTQQYGIVPPGKTVYIGKYSINNPEVILTGKICFNVNCYEVTGYQNINITGTYDIYIKASDWQPFLIKGINYENTYTCSGGVFRQKINIYNITREYTFFTSTNTGALNLTQTQYAGYVFLTWNIPGKSNILNKYVINLFAGDFLYIRTGANNLCDNTLNCEIYVPLSGDYIIFTGENIIYSGYTVIFSGDKAFLSGTNMELSGDVIVLTGGSVYGTGLLVPLSGYNFGLKVEGDGILKECSLSTYSG